MAFDTYVSTKVTLNQQPNDAADAARLYGEISEKVNEEIDKVVFSKIPNTEIAFAEMYRHHEKWNPYYTVFVKINNNPIRFDIDVDPFADADKRSTIDELAKQIGFSVLNEMGMDAYRMLQGR